MSDLPIPECDGQMDLLSMPAFQRDSDTSREAAISVYWKAPNDRARVLDYVRHNPGVTDEQIGDALRLSGNTVRPRRIELANRGLIEPDGKAKTRSGRLAVTWRAVPQGRAS